MIKMVKKSITKDELHKMVFKDTIRYELRYRVTKEGELIFLLTFVPKKGKSKTILWPITDLSEGDHALFAIDEVDKGKLQNLKKLKPKKLTLNTGLIKAEW